MITLYRAPYSTNVERVALALAHKGLEAQSVVIDYSDRSVVKRVSGQGLVPVIDYDGEVVADSPRILEYLERRHPEPPLYPADPARRAEAEVFIEWFNEVWKVPPNAIDAELGRPSPDRDLVGGHARRLRGWLELFERMLSGREYLMGDFSAADCIAYPFLKYAAGREPGDADSFHRVLDEHLTLKGHPALAAWIERMSARPRA